MNYFFEETTGSLFNLGNEFYTLEKFGEARKQYEKVLNIKADHFSAINNLACALDEEDDIEGALDKLSLVTRECPNSYMGFHNRACINQNQGSYDSALRDYNTSLALGPLTVEGFMGRAWSYNQMGMFLYALWDYSRALKLKYPDLGPGEVVSLFTWDEIEDIKKACCRILNSGFYLALRGKAGDKLITMPFPRDRIVLSLNEVHLGRVYGEHMGFLDSYELRINTDFDTIFDRALHHRENDRYELKLLRYLFSAMGQNTDSPEVLTIALYNKDDGQLAAAEFGFKVGKVFSSYSGFYEFPEAGLALSVLISRFLEEDGFVYWDLGFPSKLKQWDANRKFLGAEQLSTEVYLSLFNTANQGS